MGNIIGSLGAGVEFLAGPVGMAVRSARGEPPTGGEVVQELSRMPGTGNVAILPRPIDAMLGKIGRKLLIRQGIPANADNVFDLTRLLRGNVMAGRDMISDEVINWLSYHRRSESRKHPIGTAITGPFDSLWQEARRTLANF
jgi:hypothetical protein